LPSLKFSENTFPNIRKQIAKGILDKVIVKRKTFSCFSSVYRCNFYIDGAAAFAAR